MFLFAMMFCGLSGSLQRRTRSGWNCLTTSASFMNPRLVSGRRSCPPQSSYLTRWPTHSLNCDPALMSSQLTSATKPTMGPFPRDWTGWCVCCLKFARPEKCEEGRVVVEAEPLLCSNYHRMDDVYGCCWLQYNDDIHCSDPWSPVC